MCTKFGTQLGPNRIPVDPILRHIGPKMLLFTGQNRESSSGHDFCSLFQKDNRYKSNENTTKHHTKLKSMKEN